jgi:carbamoyl-phosphate synthase large subunit
MNILITSVGRRGYLVDYFKEAIGDDGEVHVANSNAITPAKLHADFFVETPIIYSDAYIPFLLEYCEEKNIDILISLFDVDLPILARHKEKFECIGTKLIVSDENVIDICNDKWKTFQFLRLNGFSTPRTFLSVNEALLSIEEGELSYPVVVKPRWGMGSIGVYIADTVDELRVLYQKSQNAINNSYLKFESKLDYEHSILIQEFLQGSEYGLDIINNLDGKYMNTIAKKKYTMRSGETDCAETVNNPLLKNLGMQLSSKLKHIGNLDVDVFVNDENCYILEMNARFGGGYPFSHMAGVNLPKAIINWVNGVVVSSDLLQEKWGIVSHKDILIVKLSDTSG